MEEKVLRNVLEINDLVVSFEMYQKGFRKKKLEVLHSLSLDVKEGESPSTLWVSLHTIHQEAIALLQ